MGSKILIILKISFLKKIYFEREKESMHAHSRERQRDKERET